MLTAKEVQELLQVDRSTIYRMAETGRLPAIKVGRQWRFPAGQIDQWLASQAPAAGQPVRPVGEPTAGPVLAAQLPLACLQLMQDTFAEALGVMIVVTDMAGNPVTQVSNPCGLFAAVRDQALQKCIEQWRQMAAVIDLEPKFTLSHIGLLCARGLIRVGTELKGAVVVGGIAPHDWPPSVKTVAALAAGLEVQPALLADYLNEVYHLDESRQTHVLLLVQRIANIISHILQERTSLLGRLEAIASLTVV
ncbi:MAG: PocR ligand-binding domain-containing protein [Chloroflexi bacterium]|nr:PocR ligand-binding domain-containing protein [Chloroflexota bacterium]MCI0646102.1 PocR ligand-binding domain-containing protein [Chloroflexota bacterium]MCI0731572.1 PocR ligand-binding domain-containing protein [Chloroflexota bacterium]